MSCLGRRPGDLGTDVPGLFPATHLRLACVGELRPDDTHARVAEAVKRYRSSTTRLASAFVEDGWRGVLTHGGTTYIGLMLDEAREEHQN